MTVSDTPNVIEPTLIPDQREVPIGAATRSASAIRDRVLNGGGAEVSPPVAAFQSSV
jgi:hypothetical protein